MFIWKSRNSPYNKDLHLIFYNYKLCHKFESDVTYKIIQKMNGFRKDGIQHQTSNNPDQTSFMDVTL